MTARTVEPDAEGDDVRLAETLTLGAGRVLLELRAQAEAGTFTGDAAALRSAGDAASQAYLASALADARPADRVLSEEGADDLGRLDADRVWIIDPLDGTREFAERTHDGGWRDDFAVHVALWRRHHGLSAAAVGLPGQGTVHSTASVRSPRPSPPETADRSRPLRLAVSRTRRPLIVEHLVGRPEVELVPMGSAGAKTMAVVTGTVDAYVHAGGQFEWDSAAPVAVAAAAGMVTTRLHGSPLVYNQADPWCPDLVVCRPEWLVSLERLLELNAQTLEGLAR